MVIVPLGFLSDHLEVLYDLDTETRALCEQLGLRMQRAATPGLHPKFVSMVRELVLERVEATSIRRTLGTAGPRPDVCPDDCCPPPAKHSESTRA